MDREQAQQRDGRNAAMQGKTERDRCECHQQEHDRQEDPAGGIHGHEPRKPLNDGIHGQVRARAPVGLVESLQVIRMRQIGENVLACEMVVVIHQGRDVDRPQRHQGNGNEQDRDERAVCRREAVRRNGTAGCP